MLKRLRSLQEQCRSKPSLPERPFCNIGDTSHRPQTPPVANDSEVASLHPNFVDVMSCVSTLKQNTNLSLSHCVDVTGQDDRDLSSVVEKSAKRLHSEISNEETLPSVDHVMSPLSPARKRSRQDSDTDIAATAVANDDAAAVKSSSVVRSPNDRSFDSANVELNISEAVCEPFTASSAAFGFSRSGSGTQLNNNNTRPPSAVRSANSSPRTLPSRRDIGQSCCCSRVWFGVF